MTRVIAVAALLVLGLVPVRAEGDASAEARLRTAIRAQPIESASVVLRVEAGTGLVVVGTTPDAAWIHVKVRKHDGWIPSQSVVGYRPRPFSELQADAARGAAAQETASPSETAEKTEPVTAAVEPPAGKPTAMPTCMKAYKRALELRRALRLGEAQSMLERCAHATCGASLEKMCVVQAAQLQSDLPSVVPAATDRAGSPVLDVQVTIDGRLLADRIDGRAYPVDPGVHAFSFKSASGVVVTQKVLVLQGQRNRTLTATLNGVEQAPASRSIAGAPQALTLAGEEVSINRARDARWGEARRALPDEGGRASPPLVDLEARPSIPAPRKSSKRGLIAPSLLTGVGVVGIGAFGLLTYWGKQDNDALKTCSPSCPAASVDHIRTMYLAANISLGVGAAAAVAGVTWLIVKGRSPRKTERSHSLALDVQPTRSGGLASVSGVF